jgi:hypothetical protein
MHGRYVTIRCNLQKLTGLVAMSVACLLVRTGPERSKELNIRLISRPFQNHYRAPPNAIDFLLENFSKDHIHCNDQPIVPIKTQTE